MQKETLAALILGENKYPVGSIGYNNYFAAMDILLKLELWELKKIFIVTGLKD